MLPAALMPHPPQPCTHLCKHQSHTNPAPRHDPPPASASTSSTDYTTTSQHYITALHRTHPTAPQPPLTSPLLPPLSTPTPHRRCPPTRRRQWGATSARSRCVVCWTAVLRCCCVLLLCACCWGCCSVPAASCCPHQHQPALAPSLHHTTIPSPHHIRARHLPPALRVSVTRTWNPPTPRHATPHHTTCLPARLSHSPSLAPACPAPPLHPLTAPAPAPPHRTRP
jgi:hypothetical protein